MRNTIIIFVSMHISTKIAAYQRLIREIEECNCLVIELNDKLLHHEIELTVREAQENKKNVVIVGTTLSSTYSGHIYRSVFIQGDRDDYPALIRQVVTDIHDNYNEMIQYIKTTYNYSHLMPRLETIGLASLFGFTFDEWQHDYNMLHAKARQKGFVVCNRANFKLKLREIIKNYKD